MKSRIQVLSILIFMVIAQSCVKTSQKASKWHHPLNLANNDYWRERIPVNIHNGTQKVLMGDLVEIPIGSKKGQAPLTRVLAEGVRVTTIKGDQLMYRILSNEGKLVEKGPIPGDSKIVIPVECKANDGTTNYIYYNNPSAWPLGDYLNINQKVNDSLEIVIGKLQKLSLTEKGKTDVWLNEGDNSNQWPIRAAVRTINYNREKNVGTPVCVEIVGVLNRLHADINKNGAIRITNGTNAVPFYRMKDYILFAQDIEGRTQQTNYIYFASKDDTKENIKTEELKDLNGIGTNLVRNNSFNQGSLSEWKRTNDMRNISISNEGPEGSASVQIQIADSGNKEAGLMQEVPVRPGRLYLFSSWIKCSDKMKESEFNRTLRQRTISAQFIGKDGKDIEKAGKTSLNPDVQVDNGWSQLFMLINAPENADSVKLSLLNSAPGTVWFDNVTFMEVISGATSPLAIEFGAAKDLKELTVWQQDPIVKAFQDDLPPKTINEFSISAARNEYEPLQLVIRSPRTYKQVQITADSPSDGKGHALGKPEVGVVGYVPIDYPSNYIVDRISPAWRQKILSGPYGSDGWAGWWPDPILPYQTFDLNENKSQPLWFDFRVPKNAAPGDYTGNIQLKYDKQVIKEIPYKVHVWNFQLTDKSHMTAEFDVRARSDSGKKAMWDILSAHRITPDHIIPEPKWKIENGKVLFDFTEYDKAASYFFDTLNYIHVYSPGYFYLFGWAAPPSPHFGQKPYDGESPYTGVDHSKLRPEFKKAYQSALRGYWNHMKEKGWADKVILYVSDEPHGRPEITAQMRALCDMIHEVDRKIPIYVSSWGYRKDYIGYVDIWGMSNHAGPVEDLIKIRKAGERFFYTTDGKMCTDTPYFGFERMLPYFCFKYGAEEYEFWAADWYTFNPYEYGWHRFNRESQIPGNYYWTRYPNGDGYIVYPGNLIGVKKPVPSLRLKLAREGVEDYEYLYYLNSLVTTARKEGKDVSQAEKAIESANALVTIPSEEGRYSTMNLPDPYAVLRVRAQVADAIEGLL